MPSRELQDLGYDLHLVPLTRGKFALIDSADAHRVGGYNWQAVRISNTWYAVRNERVNGLRRTVYMHRMLLGEPDGEVDHRNLDGLDNCRSNLRVASHAENNRNKPRRRDNVSGAKGVSWDAQRSKWFAKITADKRQIALGRFDSMDEARAAYERAAKALFGEFARAS